MRSLYLILFYLAFVSCKTKQDLLVENKNTFHSTECPNDGTCTLELMPNKSIKTLHDDFGTLYIEIIDGASTVLKYEYKRHEIPNTMDSQYIEQVFMELDPNNMDVDLTDSELKNVNLLFARLCFCKGETGFYRIREGKLNIDKTEENSYKFHLMFKVNEVPQIITEIGQVLKLD